MADSLDVLCRAIFKQGSVEERFQVSESAVTVNEGAGANPLVLQTNATTEVGSLGGFGTGSTNTGAKFIGVEGSATYAVNVRLSTTSATGQTPIAAGGYFFAKTTSVTGLHLNNPSTTNTATVRVRVFDL
ncbi:MAG: hypothetical protein ACE5FA_00365 [Dehalococcoidia bacterium]